jgi:AcrR family transcriptional regulator
MATPVSNTRRRPSPEVRGLIAEAARELFVANGYEKTTTKQVAAKAGVAESLIFSNFGSKAGLLDVALVEPFIELVTDFVAYWSDQSPALTPDERVERFVTGLYDLAGENRLLLLSAVMKRAMDDHVGNDALDHLAKTNIDMSGIPTAAHFDIDDPPSVVAACLAMIFGVALLDDMLFPRGTRRPSRERLIKAITRTMIYGLTGPPRDSSG